MKLHDETRKLVKEHGIDGAMLVVRGNKNRAENLLKSNKDNKQLENEINFHKEQLQILIEAKGE